MTSSTMRPVRIPAGYMTIFLEYREWLDEFCLLDAAEKAGKAKVPNGWRRAFRYPNEPGKWFVVTGEDMCNVCGEKPEDGDFPLTFEIWKLGYWKTCSQV